MKKHSTNRKQAPHGHRPDLRVIAAEIDVSSDAKLVTIPVALYTKLVADSTLFDVAKRLLDFDRAAYINADELRAAIGLAKAGKPGE